MSGVVFSGISYSLVENLFASKIKPNLGIHVHC